MKSLVLLSCAGLLAGLSTHALAWSNHSLGSLLALREESALRQEVQVEPLEAFLAAQAPAIERLLDEVRLLIGKQ